MATIGCICPAPRDGASSRHPDGDTVTLRERLDFRQSLTARNAFLVLKAEDPDASTAEVLAVLTETYLLLGIESWTLEDARGKPVPVSKAAIREMLLSHPDAAMVVGDEADALYSEAIISPLVARALSSSPTTPTSASTSATSGPSPKRRRPSKRSSTSTTQTDGIVRISPSPDGDSSSWPSSASAG
jgi:hypothetical protein